MSDTYAVVGALCASELFAVLLRPAVAASVALVAGFELGWWVRSR